MCGPIIVPASCRSEAANTSAARLDGSWIVVVPSARFTCSDQFCCGTSSSVPYGPWAWASTRPGMMVLPAMSTVRAPAGIETSPLRPTAVMRLRVTTMTPSSMMPPSALAMVTIRAPVSATTPDGRSAATSRASDTPVVGGSNFAVSSPAGASRKKASVLAV